MVSSASNRLSTKIAPPVIRPLLVKRSRLVERLRQGMKHRLTLVVAPAGYGKTTLLGEWLASTAKEGLQSAWLTLDSDDNYMLRFWGYLADALHWINPEWQLELPKMGEVANAGIDHGLLVAWINQIDASRAPFSLILDDFHAIQTDSIHTDLAYFIQHMPQNMHLVIASRMKPKLPVSELRVKNQLVEIGPADMTFSAEECETFLHEVMGLDLTPEEVAVLARTTEGWVAGLQMAALSIKNQPDVGRWIDHLNGSQSYIFDYLTEAVLDLQEPPVQDFLLKTSILAELSAPLCDYLLDRNDSLTRLDYLEETNLFTTPLSEERYWYRHHALFSEILKIRLERKYPQSLTELHLRAVTWLQDNGFAEKAIPHAFAAGYPEIAANIIESCAIQALGRSDFINFRVWVNLLPAHMLHQRPLLWIYSAMVENTLGHLDKAKIMLGEIKDVLDEWNKNEQQSKEQADLYQQISALQAVVDMHSENFNNGIPLANQVLSDLPENDSYTYGWLNHFLGYAYETTGDLESAIAAFARSDEFSRIHAIPSGIFSRCEIARIKKTQGRLGEAEHELRRHLDYAVRAGLAKELIVFIRLALADILIEQDQFEEVDEWVREIENLLPCLDIERYGWIVLIEIYTRLSNYYLLKDTDKAKKYLHKARSLLQGLKPIFYFETITDLRVKIFLAEDDFGATLRWVEKRMRILKSSGELSLTERIGLARIFLRQEQIHAAYPLLLDIEARARAAGKGENVIEAMILIALALDMRGEVDRSTETFIQVLALAEPEGYVRIFINEGKLVQRLLIKTLSAIDQRTGRKPILPSRGYIEKLLKACDRAQFFHNIAEQRKPVEPPLFSPFSEPLSERELEVVTLLRDGKTGREIAKVLHISHNTVKVHVRHIYEKLEAHNRKEALVRVAELNLID